MKVDVLSDNFLMLWFQKELAGGQNPKPKSDIWSPKCALKIPIGGFLMGSHQEPSVAKVSII